MRAAELGVSRRAAVGRLLALAGGLAAALSGPRPVGAQQTMMTASGAGVNLKMMPDVDGKPTVPMRESFAFDTSYAQCIVEDNPQRFAMDTFGMGHVVIEPHQFFMAMYASVIHLDSIAAGPGGGHTAKLSGKLNCLTYAQALPSNGTATVTVGSRTAGEPATFSIEAVDGGSGGGTAGDKFAFTVSFDPALAPVNHGVFGPSFTFTGELIQGEVTIGPPTTVPLQG